jgi:hypothetical protein
MTSEAIAPALRSRWRSRTSRFVYPATLLQITLLLILRPPLAVALAGAYCLQRRAAEVFSNGQSGSAAFSLGGQPLTQDASSPFDRPWGAPQFRRPRMRYLSAAYPPRVQMSLVLDLYNARVLLLAPTAPSSIARPPRTRTLHQKNHPQHILRSRCLFYAAQLLGSMHLP